MWNRTGSRDEKYLEHAHLFVGLRGRDGIRSVTPKDLCTSPKSLKSGYPLPNIRFLINQPKYSNRQLRHLHQLIQIFQFLLIRDFLQLPDRMNERGLDLLVADVFM